MNAEERNRQLEEATQRVTAGFLRQVDAAVSRKYTWRGVVRGEMDLRRFMALQEQAEAVYGPPPQLLPPPPLRFLDQFRRKPRRWRP